MGKIGGLARRARGFIGYWAGTKVTPGNLAARKEHLLRKKVNITDAKRELYRRTNNSSCPRELLRTFRFHRRKRGSLRDIIKFTEKYLIDEKKGILNNRSFIEYFYGEKGKLNNKSEIRNIESRIEGLNNLDPQAILSELHKLGIFDEKVTDELEQLKKYRSKIRR